jgi:hypothetical protein
LGRRLFLRCHASKSKHTQSEHQTGARYARHPQRSSPVESTHSGISIESSFGEAAKSLPQDKRYFTC